MAKIILLVCVSIAPLIVSACVHSTYVEQQDKNNRNWHSENHDNNYAFFGRGGDFVQWAPQSGKTATSCSGMEREKLK